MDMLHHIYLLARKVLHSAPLAPGSEPMRIMDLGTGTGIWAIEMAESVDAVVKCFSGTDEASKPPSRSRGTRTMDGSSQARS